MRAKDKMQKLGIDYIDINLDNFPERRAEAKERSGRNTVPQIFFNNRHIGGFDDFDKLVREYFILSSLKNYSSVKLGFIAVCCFNKIDGLKYSRFSIGA